MTKGVKICLMAAIVIFVGAVAAMLYLRLPSDSTWVAITQDGKTLYTFDLATFDDEQTQQIRIESPDGGYNIVEIDEGNTIRISEADCPDKTCVKTGELSDGVPIVCLPHKLVIKYIDPPKNGG
ncbi:NusG domain II [Ruminococcus sp. YRD2003]|uniref:NusG domain II-containing protein n=1 Tax=Ruminococcus sp. YRD2003 TaxID=1452313 RepID=UPI0008C04D19|nr:NusG domain II [Ruminococcus flavefaciens]